MRYKLVIKITNSTVVNKLESYSRISALGPFATLVSVGSCASVEESMRTAARFPMAADLRALNFGLGDVHKGRPQRRGRGYSQMRTPADRGRRRVKDLADVRKMALFRIISACFAHSLWVMAIKI